MRKRSLVIAVIAVSVLHLSGYLLPAVSSLVSFLASAVIIAFLIIELARSRDNSG